MSSASRKLIQASGGGGPADTGDDDFANVVLLLDGDGTSGDDNNTFTDSSTNGFTVTETGSVVQGSFSPYGDNWSWYTKDSAIAFSTLSTTGDYTAEAWVSVNGIDSSGRNLIFYGGNNTQLAIGYLTDTILAVINGSLVVTSSSVPELFDGSWHHVAWCRSGSTNRVFLDGNLVGSGTSSSEIRIGQISGYASGYEHDGFISNARVTNTALYTANFTPPTEPLTEVTGTYVLTAQSNRLVDNSSNQYSLTINRGTPKVAPFSPFKNDDARDITTDGGSVYFGGSDYLTVPDNADFDFGTGNFTIEFWFNTSQASGRQDPFSFYTSTNGIGIGLNYSNNQDVLVYTGNTLLINTSGSKWSVGFWNHLALARSGTTLKLFINGTEIASVTDSSNILPKSDLYLGAAGNGTQLYTGYLSDVRVIKGTAVYTSAFTPPTSPLTAITNTELLLNFQDSGIYDRTGLNNIDTVGNSQIDTAVKKYGTGSMEFDGTGDYLDTVSTEALTFGTGDFTIEFWINTSNNGNIMNPSTATGSGYWGLLMQSGNLRWNNSYAVTNLWQISASAIQDGSWHHVAISRASGSTKIFYDGTLQSTQADTTNYSGTGAWRIGSGNLAAFNGYLDDFRITKGIARYTSNFTAPDAALPKF